MSSPVTIFQLPLSYLLWHYTIAWADLVRLYRNIAWFLWNFFSIGLLLRTLLSPWRRLHEGARKEAGGLLGSLIMNTLLRCIGFFARAATIFFGLASLVLWSVLFVGFLVLWPLMPLIAPALTLMGLLGLLSF
jgi:hypothetical protein